MRLASAIIFVKDMRTMAAFYGDVLGLRLVNETRTETWQEFKAGKALIALHAVPAPLAGQIAIESPPRPRENNPVKLVFEVDDLPFQLSRLEQRGVPLIERPGGGAVDLVDPEGNILQLCAAAGAPESGPCS